MNIPESVAPEFDLELANAVDGIVSALADGESLEHDPSVAMRALEDYLANQRRITVAAQHEYALGLPTACAFMEANLLELIGRATPLRAEETTLLDMWPVALIEYCANPADESAAAGLVACLSDRNWSSPLAAADGIALQRIMMAAASARVEFATQSHTQVAQPFEPAPVAAKPAEADPMGTMQQQFAPPHSFVEADTFTTIPYSTRLRWMNDLAENKGLGGIQECCDRVRSAIETWERQNDGMTSREHASLDEFFDLAKHAVAGTLNQSIVDRLLSLLGQSVWPDPLVDDELDLVTELLHADRLVADPLVESAQDDQSAVQRIDEGADSPEAPAMIEDGNCAWLSEQPVPDELIALLANEIESARDALRQTLDATFAADEARAREAMEQYADELDRIGTAADAVGLLALSHYVGELKRLVVQCAGNALSDQQRDQLALFPGVLAGYLRTPNDPSAAEGLVDLLRSEAWVAPPCAADAARLVRGLSLVTLSREAAAGPVRQVDARPEDMSLAIPGDVNQELLDGLLQELPVQTGEFSSAMQNIAGGHGSLGDLDAAKRAAHTLKGAANTVGVRGIANLTHHLEDILIALSAHQAMPNRSLGETLLRASDCLETMSEAVTGTGPEPQDALAVLQDVLNWANSIDHDGVPDSDDVSPSVPDGETAKTAVPKPAPTPGLAGTMVRVPAALIDELLRLLGETIISTGQIRDRIGKVVRHNQTLRGQVSSFLHLTNELEELVDIGGGAAQAGSRHGHEEFDSLEFEHFSELHTISRRLIEAATDAREMGSGIDDDLTELRELADAQERLHQQSQAVVMQTRMIPVSSVVARLQRGVRQACRLLDKDVSMQVSGAETLIDSNILNELMDPLMHVLRNAVDHGIEPASIRNAAGKPAAGRIELAIAREGNQVVVRCRDDGAGLDLAAIRRTAQDKQLVAAEQVLSDDELSRLILAPGFSTRDEATQVSGRGIGMDIVRSHVQQMKGSLNLHSQHGQGLTVELRLPAALISTHALIVRSEGERLAISSHGIQDIHYVVPDQLQDVAGTLTYRVGDTQLKVVDLAALLGLPGDRRNDPRSGFPLLIVRPDSGALRAVKVHEVLQSRNLVVKALGSFVPKLRGVVGATILGDGSVAAVVDLPEIMEVPVQLPHGVTAANAEAMRDNYQRSASAQLTALVVDDSLSARRATAQFMKDTGYEVRTAIDGLEAASILEKWTPDVMLVDMEMPRMSGLELTSHVRASAGALARVPIIMITSRSTVKHRKQAEASGVSVYLTKPFSDEELLKHVSQLTMA